MLTTSTKRLQILSEAEITELYSVPVFTHSDREEYFSLDDETTAIVDSCRKLSTKVYFVLLLGYFRCKPIVFNLSFEDLEQDIEYILAKHFNRKFKLLDELSPSSKTNVIQLLLKYTGYLQFQTKHHKAALLDRLYDVATISFEPRYVLDECIAFFSQKQICLPGYTTLQKMVSSVLVEERKRIEKVLRLNMSKATRSTLNDLLQAKNTFTDLAMIKRAAKDFSSEQVHRELDTHRMIKSIYPEIKTLVKLLGLSQKNLEYYASLIRHKSIYKIRRHSDSQALLYLVCYLFFRYRESNDNLVSAFTYMVRKLSESALSFAKLKIAEDVEAVRTSLKKAGSLIGYFVDTDIDDDMRFGDVRERAFSEVPQETIVLLKNHLNKKDFTTEQYEWTYIDDNKRKVKGLLRSIFRAVELDFSQLKPEFVAQFDTALNELSIGKTIATINLKLVRPSERKYIECENKTDLALRFEFFLYRKIESLFRSNQLSVTESINNRSLASDLIPVDEWQHSGQKIVEKTGLESLNHEIKAVTQQKIGMLKERLSMVRDHILSGENQYVEFVSGKQELRWSIPNKRWQESVNNPIYNQITHMGIVELINFVQEKTNFLESFTHIANSQAKSPVDNNDLIACILGNGTNYGLYKMANISDRSVGRLRSVEDSYLREETLTIANDAISNAIAGLPIFSHYHIENNQIHSSIDGQKFSCRINTFKARYSSKDFFKGKGVSVLTLVSNHVPVNTQVIGANEYEGHFAFDLLFNNTSEIQTSTLSTDSHGSNNVNFALLDLFGYSFAPRYAKVKHHFFDLFEIKEESDEIIIDLKKPINEQLICDEWDSIQHIICSLSRKTGSQSTIVRKLSNGKSKTLAALREYDRLIKSLYLLEYVDNNTLRHYVQQALNRGEAYHQLKRAIASVNGNRFRGGNDYQVSLWNDCARLISNSIIYYNSSLLSVFLNINKGNKKVTDYIGRLSPVAWQHINLNGEYAFEEQESSLNLNRLLSGIDVI